MCQGHIHNKDDITFIMMNSISVICSSTFFYEPLFIKTSSFLISKFSEKTHLRFLSNEPIHVLSAHQFFLTHLWCLAKNLLLTVKPYDSLARCHHLLSMVLIPVPRALCPNAKHCFVPLMKPLAPDLRARDSDFGFFQMLPWKVLSVPRC